MGSRSRTWTASSAFIRWLLEAFGPKAAAAIARPANGGSAICSLAIAAQADIPHTAGDYSLTQFYAADEVFVTGTMGGLTPVVRLDGRPIGSGSPGPVTKRLGDLYADLTARTGTLIS